ncbi:MAG: CsgG/HfaB family protein [Kiritimatiellae bacterium]|nr:CsgG/HfaB family protein [Kiritimatiellia bacterium]MDW8458651.1 CsgG/HfaB family protein [Verrucomicrobiota bacterium]
MRLPWTIIGFVLLSAGCAAPPGGSSAGFWRREEVLKPVVAVTDFENRSGFSGQWNLGSGMADLLVNRLVASDRVIVLERRKLGDVVGELVRQGESFFRSEGRVERGRLKNAEYLIRGVVTDFTVTGDTSGWFGTRDAAIRGRGQEARVALVLTVMEVETGEVISSVRAEGFARAGGWGGDVNYRGIQFGGDAFFRTPLGRATEAALERAVKRIVFDLPRRPWEPRVADLVDGKVVVNGGKNVGVRVGDEYLVRKGPRAITDPVTGNVIDRVPGDVSGRIRIVAIKDFAAYAEVLDGSPKRGDVLEKIVSTRRTP